MAESALKPWEKYAQKAVTPASTGKPWEKYAQPAVADGEEAGGGIFLNEVAKSVGRGAVKAVGTGLKGLAANQAESPTEQATYDQLISELPNISSMSDEEFTDFNRRATSELRGLNGLRLIAKARLIREGEIEPDNEQMSLDVLPDTPIEETGLYKAGEATQRFADQSMPVAPDYEGGWTQTLGEGAGSMIPFLAAALVGGPAGGIALGTGLGTSLSAGEAVERAVAAGADPQEIINAAELGKLPGLSEHLPMETLLERIPLPFAGKAASIIHKIAAQAAVEGGQEAFQQVAQNLIERYVYDPEQDISEGILEAATVGGILGGGFKAGQQAASGVKNAIKGKQPAPDPSATVETGGPDLPLESPVTQDAAVDAGAPPGQQAASAISPEARAILRRSQMTDEDIDAMSPEEVSAEVENARAAGVAVNEAMIRKAAEYQSPETQQQPPAMERLDDPAAAAQRMAQTFDPDRNRQQIAEDIASQVRVDEDELYPRRAKARQMQADFERKKAAGEIEPPRGTRNRPTLIETDDAIDDADLIVNPAPTVAQKEAGNYRKYHAKMHGFDISIETPKGGVREGRNRKGDIWQTRMPAHYGYIKRTEGADGDHVDVYVGPNAKSQRVYVVDQVNELKQFDEHKVIMGVGSVSEARDIYARGFSDGRGIDRLGAITPMSVSEFRKWLREGDTKKPLRFGQSQVRTNDDGFPIDKNGLVKKPESLIEFLARMGGVRDETGELAAMDLTRRKTGFVAGAGPLVRKNGMTPDKAREAAVEAGYLVDPGEGENRPSESYVSDLYDALGEDAGSREKFAHYDADWEAAWRAQQGQEEASAREEEFSDVLDEVAKVLSIDRDDDFAQSVARAIYEEGGDIGDVAERIAIQEADQAEASVDEAFPDIPFFEDSPDEVHAGTASESGATGGTPGQHGEGPRAQGEPQEGGATVQDRGEGGPQDDREADDSGRAGESAGESPAAVDDFDRGFNEGLAELTEEPGADDKPQTVIPGAERIPDKQKAEREGEKPLKAKKPQQEPGGMFDEAETAPQLFDKLSTPEATAKPNKPTPKPNSASTKPNSVSAKPSRGKKPDAPKDKAGDKIDDFGETLHGARKHLVAEYGKTLDEDVDLTTQPLSKVFPQPNFEKLAEAGVDRDTLALVAVMRDMVPPKPRKAYKVKRWAEQVDVLRDFSAKLINGEISPDTLHEKLESPGNALLRPVGWTAKAIRDVEPSRLREAAGFRIKSGAYSMFAGERFSPSRTIYDLTTPSGRKAQASTGAMQGLIYDQDIDKMIEKARDFITAHLAKGPVEAPTRSKYTPLKIYRNTKTGDIYLAFKVRSSVIKVVGGFETVQDAIKHRDENKDALQAKIDEMRAGPNERNAENRERTGRDRRDGDITPEAFSEAFGFRGVQFGNYVEGGRRQGDLNRAYDALHDLAEAIGIPPRALSLNGQLGLAFGARGRGGKKSPAAHYEPGNIVINLTKNSGPGSLAHEWFHGVDNYFAREDGRQEFMTEATDAARSIRPEVREAFAKVAEAVERGGYFERAKEFDKARSKPYFSTIRELTARAFERFIIDRLEESGVRNDYLANIDTESGVYPTPEEMSGGIRAAYDRLFDVMDSKPTPEGNERLYSLLKARADQPPVFYSALLQQVINAKQGSAQAKDWKAIIAKLPGVKRAEIEWLGIEEWLDTQEGQQVSREALADYIRANQVDLVEDVRSGEEVEYNFKIEIGEKTDPDPGFLEEQVESLHLDDAIAEIAEAEDIDPEDVDRGEAMERAVEMAEEAYWSDPDGDFAATLYDPDSGISFDGYYNSYDRDYFFSELMDGENVDEQTAIDLAENYARKNATNADAVGPALHETYTERGGENYRELLLRVPDLHTTGKNTQKWEVGPDGIGREVSPSKRPFVQRGHFEEENIVVHARVKDRTDVDGNKVLFVEEIQSDLGSKWRKGTEPEEVTALRRELEQRRRELNSDMDKAWADMQRRAEELAGPNVPLHRLSIREMIGEARPSEPRLYEPQEVQEFVASLQGDPEFRKSLERRQAIIDRADDIDSALINLGTEKTMDPSVPDTPFKDENYYVLMAKRLLREAVDKGYGKLAWTPGYMQAERWNKAAQSVVNSVSWATARNGNRVVTLNMSGGSPRELQVSPGGVIESGFEDAEGKPLATLIGPGVAKEVMGEPSGTVSGQKITFPSSGYAIAYDQHIRKAVTKLVKRYGVRVREDRGLNDFTTHEGQEDALAEAIKDMGMTEAAEHIISTFPKSDTALAKDLAQRLRKKAADPHAWPHDMVPLGISAIGRPRMLELFDVKGNPVWSVEINDAMREGLREGLPLFDARQQGRMAQPPSAVMPAEEIAEIRRIVREVSGLDDVIFMERIEAPAGLADWGNAAPMAAAGYYDPADDVIAISLSDGDRTTAYHEAFHRIQNLFLSPREKAVLERESERLRQIVAASMPDMDVRQIGQIELEAEAFALYAEQMEGNRATGIRMHTGIRRAWNRIIRIMRAVRNALRGFGYQTAEDIFERALRSDMAERGSNQRRGDPRILYSLAPASRSTVPDHIEPRNSPAALLGQRLDKAVTDIKKMSPKDRRHAEDGESAGEWTHRKWVDYLHPVRMMQERVAGKGNLSDLNDAYLNARLAEDAALAEIQELHDVYVVPALEGLVDAGASIEELHDLLYAEHAQERNRVIGERNPEDSDLHRAITDPSVKGASGWSTNEANETIARLKADKQKYRALRRAADGVRAMLKANLAQQRRAGLISAETHDLLTQQWQNYVPLKGHDGMDDQGNWRPSKGKGFDVRGDEFHAAVGRYSEADNVLAHAISQAELTILRAKKNDVGKAMLRFINEFDPEGKTVAEVFWSGTDEMGEIHRIPDVYKRVLGKDGKVQHQKVPNPFSRLDDVLATKVGGKVYYIRFKDEKVGLALRKMGKVELDAVSKLMRKYVTGWQSLINTRANPAFIPVNIIRDAQTGAVHLLDEGFNKREAIRAIADIPKAWGALWRRQRGRKGDGEWDQALAEYVKAGGKINFDARIQDFDQQLASIQKQTRAAAGDMSKLRTAWESLVKFVTDLNDAGENGMRLVAFKMARESGKTPKQAAFIGRDLTVDFKKHGEMNPLVNSWFVFFNAALQGNYNIARRLSTSKAVRKVVIGAMFGGMMQHFWNLAMAGEDEDGESHYLKLLRNEPYRLERQMLFFIPGTDQYVSFPLPYGYNAFWHLGAQGGAITSGDKDILPGLLDSFRVWVEAMNPIGSGSLSTMLAPTVADPAVELLENKNFFGGEIYPAANPFDQSPAPDSQRAWRSTHPIAKDGAEWLNWITGGNEIESGAIDIHPDTLEHMWGYFTGGIGRFFAQGVETGQRTLEGEFEPKKTPYVRTFYGQMDERSQKNEYYRQREAALTARGELKKYQDKGDREDLLDFQRRHAIEIKAIPAYVAAEKQRRKINKQRRAIEGSSMTAAEKKQRLKELEQVELEIMRQARTAFAKARKGN
ncbi:LPD38 domain-containing protein [Pseudohoeflea coraliihabitans]|uniref:Large polyvalent protein-associated domain-containing protein n=1 Tax=Pseudohoeflea coraliihabitans TaxID=2860393 RepID=A0ABS6WTC1_9HYPH|nr:LPD38 domain-containing protein [Pseudohoeflea sp. DP4N28-3]MBW3099196.1 hypothetical protein [Pseudohoeflea sp. DP4N28-3]